MDYIYRESFKLAGNALDRCNRLKPSALLDMMQQAATSQCDQLSLGWKDMETRGLIWAVTRTHVQILRQAAPGSTITLETWPGVTSRVAYPRSTVGYDSQGNELFRGISLWVLMDRDTRKMVLPGKSGLELPGIERGGELAVPGSLAPVKLEGLAQRVVRYSELDRNGHMSNTRYLDWMEDLLPGSFHREHPLMDFTITYLNEAREGQRVDMSYALDEHGIVRLEATGETGHRVFAIRALYG